MFTHHLLWRWKAKGVSTVKNLPNQLDEGRRFMVLTQAQLPGNVVSKEENSRLPSKASCITFYEATEDTVDYVLIRDGSDICNSELGRTGGKQEINF